MTENNPTRAELIVQARELVDSWHHRGSWTPDSPVGMVMHLADSLEALTAERDALAAILAEAPHASYHDGETDWYCGVYAGEDCDCWKSKVPADVLAARDAQITSAEQQRIADLIDASVYDHGSLNGLKLVAKWIRHGAEG